MGPSEKRVVQRLSNLDYKFNSEFNIDKHTIKLQDEQNRNVSICSDQPILRLS